MSRIQKAEVGTTSFERLLGHNKSIMEHWSSLGQVLTEDGALSAVLKEQVRRTLAQKNGCAYCKAKGKPDPESYNERTALAVGFAEVFLAMRGVTPVSSIQVLKEVFNDQEISELCAFISFMTASQYVGAILGLEPDKTPSHEIT